MNSTFQSRHEKRMKKFSARFSENPSPQKYLALFLIAITIGFVSLLFFDHFANNGTLILVTFFIYLIPLGLTGIFFSYYPIMKAPMKVKLLGVVYGIISYYSFLFSFSLLEYHEVEFNILHLFHTFINSFTSTFEISGIPISTTPSNIEGITVISLGATLLMILFLLLYKKKRAKNIGPNIKPDGLVLASPISRFFAIALEIVIFVGLLGAIQLTENRNISVVTGILILALWITVMIWLMINRSQTLGKYLLNLQVVHKGTDQRIGFWRYLLLREFVGRTLVIGVIPLLNIVVAPYQLLDFLSLFREDRRTIHDMIAGTQVICLPKEKKWKTLFDFHKL